MKQKKIKERWKTNLHLICYEMWQYSWNVNCSVKTTIHNLFFRILLRCLLHCLPSITIFLLLSPLHSWNWKELKNMEPAFGGRRADHPCVGGMCLSSHRQPSTSGRRESREEEMSTLTAIMLNRETFYRKSIKSNSWSRHVEPLQITPGTARWRRDER